MYLSNMKALLLSFLAFSLYTCTEISKNTPRDKGIDGCVMEIPPHILERDQNDRLSMLFANPMNLAEYKAEYGTSNSGSGKDKAFYNIPSEKGFTYQYMLFHKLKKEITPTPTESELFDGFRITSYIFGNEVPNYSDTNEVLLEIVCKLDNPTLGRLNVYGMNTENIIFEYGLPHYKHNNHFIYKDSSNTAFSIHFSNDKADWFKYIKLNASFNLDEEIPSILLED